MSDVYLGDCLNIMPKFIKDRSVDLILCDLPYGTTQNKWDSVIPLDKLWSEYKRIIKDDGSIILTSDGIFTGVLMLSNKSWFKYKLIWNKVNTTGFLNAKIMPLRQHEDILIFSSSKTKYNPIKVIRGKPRKKGGYAGGNKGTYGHHEESIKVNNEYYPTSIIQISNSRQKSKIHPTQKPVSLFEYLIKTYSNKGDLVLDNCGGSGTTAIACLNTERNYILIEKEKKYFDMINDRIKNWRLQGSKNLFSK